MKIRIIIILQFVGSLQDGQGKGKELESKKKVSTKEYSERQTFKDVGLCSLSLIFFQRKSLGYVNCSK